MGKTCYLYKEEFQNPKSNYADFSEGDRFYWARFNAELPFWRTASEQSGLLKMVIQEWWHVSDDELENEYTEHATKDDRTLYDFELRQSVLVQRLISDWHEYWTPKEEMK